MPTSVKETKKPENKNPAKPKEKDKTKPNKTITDHGNQSSQNKRQIE